MSTAQLSINLWLPRVTGSITFISSVCMLLMAWKRRNHLFHRLILGLSLHQLVYSLFLIYGAAAIPSDEINVIGNYGTVATCTTQGFFIYVCSISSYFYYASFSVYSFVGVLHNFEKEKYMWVEKYIHAIVPIYPLITAFVILSKQGFNNSGGGFCSSTLNYGTYFFIVYIVIILLFSTAIMVFLYVKVTQKHLQIFIRAKTVAQQATIYLFALYLALLPSFITVCMLVSGYNTFPVWVGFFVPVNLSLFDLWIMFTYVYFTFDRFGSSSNSNGNVDVNGNSNDNGNGNDIRCSVATVTTNITTTNNNEVNLDSSQTSNSKEFIFGTEEITAENITAPVMVTSASAPTPVPRTSNNNVFFKMNAKAIRRRQRMRRRIEAEQPKYSFNIFDGTNASGEFAAFIHDGDSDDEKVDNAITDHWAAVQDHI